MSDQADEREYQKYLEECQKYRLEYGSVRGCVRFVRLWVKYHGGEEIDPSMVARTSGEPGLTPTEVLLAYLTNLVLSRVHHGNSAAGLAPPHCRAHSPAGCRGVTCSAVRQEGTRGRHTWRPARKVRS